MILNREDGISISPMAEIDYFAKMVISTTVIRRSWSLCRRIANTMCQKSVQSKPLWVLYKMILEKGYLF